MTGRNAYTGDFGNGFNVEVNGVSRANRKGAATLYLWFGGHAYDCLIVKTLRDVGWCVKAIGEAMDDLCEHFNSPIAHGSMTAGTNYSIKKITLKKTKILT